MSQIELKQAEIDNLQSELANSAWKQRQSVTSIRKTQTYSFSQSKTDYSAQPEPVSVNISTGPKVEEFKNQNAERNTSLDKYEESRDSETFAHLQKRDEPAPRASVTVQEK